MLVDSSVVFGHVDKDIEGTLTIKMIPLYIVINCFSVIFLYLLGSMISK